MKEPRSRKISVKVKNAELFELTRSDNGLYVGGQRVLLEQICTPKLYEFLQKPSSIDETIQGILPRSALMIALREFSKSSDLTGMNGYIVLDIDRSLRSDGNLKSDDWVQYNTRFIVQFQVCRWRYESKK